MRPIYFFDIPIYRLSQEKYSAKLNEYLTKKLNTPGMSEFFKHNPSRLLQQQDFYSLQFGGMWEYNEIIGHIKLYILGSQIRGEYYRVNAKNIVKTRKKQFKFVSHKIEAELEIPLLEDNIAIYKAILTYIDNCKKNLKNRFVDSSLFEVIGKHIDWKELFKI